MEHHLTFERVIQYDPGQPGITGEEGFRLR
jgi:hypothetical protein